VKVHHQGGTKGLTNGIGVLGGDQKKQSSGRASGAAWGEIGHIIKKIANPMHAA